MCTGTSKEQKKDGYVSQLRFHMVEEKMDRAYKSGTFGYKFKKGPSNHAERFQKDSPQSSEIQHVKNVFSWQIKKAQSFSHFLTSPATIKYNQIFPTVMLI